MGNFRGRWKEGVLVMQDDTFRTDDTYDETDQTHQTGPERGNVNKNVKRSKPFWERFSIVFCIHYSETKRNPFPVHGGNSCLHQHTPRSHTAGLLLGLMVWWKIHWRCFVMPCLPTIRGESKNRKELFKLSTTSFPVTESRMGSEAKWRMSQDMLNFSNWDRCPMSIYFLFFVVFFWILIFQTGRTWVEPTHYSCAKVRS